MGYVNPNHRGRLVYISHFPDAFSDIQTVRTHANDIETVLGDSVPALPLFLTHETGGGSADASLYYFPFLFHKNGLPWYEANSHLYNLARNKPMGGRPTDDLRRRASKLLDYLIFCEDNELGWRDFSGRRPILRPTYRYYAYLCGRVERSNAVINQYTGAVYGLFKYIASVDHGFDLERVDTVHEVKMSFEGANGRHTVNVQKRSQTKPRAPASSTAIGCVLDEGEELRPLANEELKEFLSQISQNAWSVQERLILLTALLTGARKQTVLTLRLKQVEQLAKAKLNSDMTYRLHVGPGTGVDTKRNQRQTLYVPKQLAEELIMYSQSHIAVQRRRKFSDRYKFSYELLPQFAPSDDYLFLSDQGGCYYMARSDPRYNMVSSRPTGQVTDTICRKLFDQVSKEFPRDFTYHWLRATYAFQLYQKLQPLLASGELLPGEEISFIQARMHHKYRETTERYLKLFRMHSEKLRAQELYEENLMTS